MHDERLVEAIEEAYDDYARDHEHVQLAREFLGHDIRIRRAAWSSVRSHLRSIGYELADMNLGPNPAEWSLDFLQRCIQCIRTAEAAAARISLGRDGLGPAR